MRGLPLCTLMPELPVSRDTGRGWQSLSRPRSAQPPARRDNATHCSPTRELHRSHPGTLNCRQPASSASLAQRASERYTSARLAPGGCLSLLAAPLVSHQRHADVKMTPFGPWQQQPLVTGLACHVCHVLQPPTLPTTQHAPWICCVSWAARHLHPCTLCSAAPAVPTSTAGPVSVGRTSCTSAPHRCLQGIQDEQFSRRVTVQPQPTSSTYGVHSPTFDARACSPSIHGWW